MRASALSFPGALGGNPDVILAHVDADPEDEVLEDDDLDDLDDDWDDLDEADELEFDVDWEEEEEDEEEELDLYVVEDDDDDEAVGW